jgi:dTDP-4-dehydrorhamnose 3,5-epimerase
MHIVSAPFEGTAVIGLDPAEDDRGFFARVWCAREFAAWGLHGQVEQCSLSFNRRRGTIRGLHFACAPSRECKLVRVVRGAVWDVIVDVRRDSATYGSHYALELSDHNRHALFLPPGVAHGYQTLVDDAELLYMMSDFYNPALDRGVRFDDGDLGIRWPLEVTLISERDRSLPEFRKLQEKA